MEHYLNISQVAKLVGVNPQTIRRWDKSGKFVSSRHPINNYRVYTQNQVEVLLTELKSVKNIVSVPTGSVEASPCFQTKLGKLYNLDVIDFFKLLPSQSVDLIFAAPPTI